MYTKRKAAMAFVLACGSVTLSGPSWGASELAIMFDVKGEKNAVRQFYKIYQNLPKNKQPKYCKDEIDTDESGQLHVFIVCEPATTELFSEDDAKEIFGQIGVVFNETASPKSPLPDISMSITAGTLSCGSKRCTKENPGYTPCWSPSCTGNAYCLHYGHNCSEAVLHKCQ